MISALSVQENLFNYWKNSFILSQSYCLKVKEMDDEEYSYAALQEPLYRVETGNYEYRLVPVFVTHYLFSLSLSEK